jgi:hypothetical protein
MSTPTSRLSAAGRGVYFGKLKATSFLNSTECSFFGVPPRLPMTASANSEVDTLLLLKPSV